MPQSLDRERGSILLFAVLVLYVFGFPYLAASAPGRVLVGGMAAALPVLTLATLRPEGWRLWLGVALGLPAVAAIVQLSLGLNLVGSLVGQAVPTVFFAFATALLVEEVVRSARVRIAEILLVLSGYLLMAYTWWSAYVTVELARPGSFSASSGKPVEAGDLLYFSVVTLTTLGYGDLAPVSNQARSLAMLEALSGVLYLAVLVARLVAAYRSVETDAQ